MAGTFTLEQVHATYKPRDAWWTVFLVDPLASRLVKVTANRTSITPNQLTVAALLLGFVSAGLFWGAATWQLIVGALVFHLAFVVDCMDGKIARLKGTGTILGGWLDYIFDRVRVFVCALALFGGQYRETGRPIYLVLAAVVPFLEILRNLDALRIAQVVDSMNARVVAVCAERGIDPARWLSRTPADDELSVAGAGGEVAPEVNAADAAVGGSWFARLRTSLRRHRVRPHLFSGIEFQMFVFIVAPLTTLILPVTMFAVVLLLVFEVAVIYRLVRSARAVDALLRGAS